MMCATSKKARARNKRLIFSTALQLVEVLLLHQFDAQPQEAQEARVALLLRQTCTDIRTRVRGA